MQMNGEELTEEQTALYDRQIRVWGVDAQKRLGKAHVLVSGITGTVAEFCKNIVLAGVCSVTLIDDRPPAAVEEANFLIPSDRSTWKGKSISELCSRSLRDFNPMVHVTARAGDISGFGADDYAGFDAVVAGCCNLSKKKLVNERCRAASKHVAFYTVDCRGSCGEIFADLRSYAAKDAAAAAALEYPSFRDAVSVPWGQLPKRVHKLYFAMRVVEEFEEDDDGRATHSVLHFRDRLCEKNSVPMTHVPDELLERLVVDTREFPPSCAVLGGILAQEVIKGISGTGRPLLNFFFFDALDGKGIIEKITPSFTA